MIAEQYAPAPVDVAKIAYLLMLSDGEKVSEEQQLFNSLCSELKVDPTNISNSCKQELLRYEGNNLERVKAVIRKIVSQYRNGRMNTCYFTLWMMITMAFADKNICAEEVAVVRSLAEEWEIDSSVVTEMFDIADEMQMLNDYQMSLPSSSIPSSKVAERIELTKKDIQSAVNTIESLIANAQYGGEK